MSRLMWAVIPAAGVGKRMLADCPKQYLTLAGQSILDRSIAIFLENPQIAGVVVGISQGDAYWPESNYFSHDKVHVVEGGKERSDTVLNGLKYLQSKLDDRQQNVLVHDAARPLLTQQALNRIIQHQGDQGAILAMPSRDTVKWKMSDTQQAEKTLDRNNIWLAQTPQKFPLETLSCALQQANELGIDITDECSAMEAAGYQPDLIVGESSNLKLTLPEDLLIAEALLSFLSSQATTQNEFGVQQ
ncbi:2-C-methyl-D-erythritol 4-phosphate cytidylyltransferase [Marinomonas sp. C2222]|uniref:2-C-methyl-D-erythritol 4-phosphate cytidylyltransferase n=1 Tax=Marinomonas sargassi TaxID=2984494 RepID=A0ABT2YV56_9GAMM|nr:2-C-methyl-D-erythritol 4-phosphate cytidylyltransferase [Marinomonas sargassi]MCV2403783.1 2-C-methyl-D-erythritol 4-phosphate cytidylyltransferase [Marinomonas sargassi]